MNNKFQTEKKGISDSFHFSNKNSIGSEDELIPLKKGRRWNSAILLNQKIHLNLHEYHRGGL